jgi:hypothetical protein
MNLIAALGDPNLFGPLFVGASWAPWRCFLRALFGLQMSDAEVALYQTHTERSTVPTRAFTEAALIIGRRGGKSRVLALIAVYLGCFKNYDAYLSAGEVATISIIASDRRQARVIFRFISGMLDATPMLRAMVTDESAEAISLSNRVVIEIHTCSFRATRPAHAPDGEVRKAERRSPVGCLRDAWLPRGPDRRHRTHNDGPSRLDRSGW